MRGCEDHELQERMKQKVLRQMFAEWVGMKADIWANAPEAKRPMDYETFLHETGILNHPDPPKNELQRLYRKALFDSVIHELFVDWFDKQKATGRDERELVFGAFVSEEGYLVRKPPMEALCQT